ncbi:response regulator [Sporolactobacillus kofuensis]|uniref:Response regulator n=1 Tax=Sporolactobacillus kofuensis TaxID=269672 RepID=A0ABW1WG26_9BACL|nr:response regulator [Sporolactobacillus kofuensis]MCO7176302.1 response regulator [Sporolactobacillus kofuensis]
MVEYDATDETGQANAIMIVDDQPGIRMLLTEVFKKEGYHVFVAANGYQALTHLKRKHPALVLLDMKLPDMSGLELLAQLKQLKPNLKVIMMTAYGEGDLVQQALRSGAIAYFTKPFDLQELISVVESQTHHISSK